jgi:aspartate racemase
MKDPMLKHIGIVACSAEGAGALLSNYLRRRCTPSGTACASRGSLHSLSLADYVDCLDRGDLQGVGDLMLSSAHKLAAIGADFFICPDNTIHQAFPFVESRSPRPWLHIAEIVAAEATRRGVKRLGLAGTRWLVDSAVYPEKLAARNLACVRPTEAERDETHRIIMDELVYGVSSPKASPVSRSCSRA